MKTLEQERITIEHWQGRAVAAEARWRALRGEIERNRAKAEAEYYRGSRAYAGALADALEWMDKLVPREESVKDD
jgi:hypothetical protein